ncbi:HutD/Ves family protein [Dickeya zeae]|uniref:HutD family protein n=1 Tax=Dickeya zeae TaxID=204042 RepID=A0ABX8W2S1_9GAMM|nr:HutD family protein [Dickeya zeae]MCO7260420.1 HutD family protein [Dickeya zeae]QYM94112.1 HutD family protein [Dickeya zeae]
MHRFSLDRLAVSRWKNGGGDTREICRVASGRHDGDFAWRASIATIEKDGDFSRFPGVDRVITLLSGEGVDLCGEGWQHRLTLHQPFAFTGEQAITARLCGGVSLDFNIMVARGDYQAEMTVVRGSTVQTPDTDGIAYVLAGHWRVDTHRLAAGEGTWWRSSGVCWTPDDDNAALLLATIHAR